MTMDTSQIYTVQIQESSKLMSPFSRWLKSCLTKMAQTGLLHVESVMVPQVNLDVDISNGILTGLMGFLQKTALQ